MIEIKSEIANARFAIAVRMLMELLSRRPESSEAAYLLGNCEQRRGHLAAAAEAWARVKPGSEFSQQTVRARMRLAEDAGQLAEAERIINEAAEDPRNDGTELRAMLVTVYSQLGRLHEAERLVEGRWEQLNATGQGASERAIFQLRLHISLALKPNRVENVRAYLAHVSALASEDDRIWLGRANLAIRTGNLHDANRWLEACLKRRPDDIAVWRSRLTWGMAADRIDVVQVALTHLPFAESTPAELHRLRAWLASRHNDVESERKELERLATLEPGDLTALDRLAQLAEQDGQPARAAQLRDDKTDLERQRTRYEKLYDRKQPIRDAVEMAQLAEHLGRWFEARAFLTLAVSEAPERADLARDLRRLNQAARPVESRPQTLAEALAHQLGNDEGSSRAPEHSSVR